MMVLVANSNWCENYEECLQLAQWKSLQERDKILEECHPAVAKQPKVIIGVKP